MKKINLFEKRIQNTELKTHILNLNNLKLDTEVDIEKLNMSMLVAYNKKLNSLSKDPRLISVELEMTMINQELKRIDLSDIKDLEELNQRNKGQSYLVIAEFIADFDEIKLLLQNLDSTVKDKLLEIETFFPDFELNLALLMNKLTLFSQKNHYFTSGRNKKTLNSYLYLIKETLLNDQIPELLLKPNKSFLNLQNGILNKLVQK